MTYVNNWLHIMSRLMPDMWYHETKETGMKENNKETLLTLLRSEVVPAMGCTEPAASALAGAKAREYLEGDVAEVRIAASRDMVKNAMGVGIPNCPHKGIAVAVALGVAGGDSSKKLNILSNVSPEMVERASALKTELEMVRDVPALYVEVTLKSDTGHTASVAISGEHDSFSRIVVDGKTLVENGATCYSNTRTTTYFDGVSLNDIVDFADTVDVSDLDFLRTAIEENMKIASYSMKHRYGLQVGRVMAEGMDKPADLDQAFRLGSAYAAAGSDARMSGCTMPVYINSGSGNQGMTVTIPVKIAGDFLGLKEDRILRAACVSELVGLMLTEKKNRLSALCGAFTASIGTACGYVHLMGGDPEIMDKAINTMVANLTGIICDGAKKTCALKIYSCLEAAAMSVKLAFNGNAPDECGIVGADSGASISNLSRITSQGMEEPDQTIYSILVDSQK